MAEIHELFVLSLFLVWFAGATPDKNELFSRVLFSFLPFLLATPLPLLFLGKFSPFSPPRKVLCSVE